MHYAVLVWERTIEGHVTGRDHYDAMPGSKQLLAGLSPQKPGQSMRVLRWTKSVSSGYSWTCHCRNQASPCGFCGEQSHTGTSFLPSTVLGFPNEYQSTSV